MLHGLSLLFLLAVSGGGTGDGSLQDWPQWLGPLRDGVWRETGLVSKFPAGGPKVVWRAPVGGGYSGPAVAGGRVYVMDRTRTKDASGKPARPTRAGIPGTERVLCFDVSDGRLIWKHEYDCLYKISFPAGPRTTPVVQGDAVYTLGAMGDVCCLDAATGSLRWSKKLTQDYHAEPPVWGWSNHLLVDGNRVYCLVGGKGSAVVAFDASSGKEMWRGLDTEEIAYSPPMIVDAGGKRQLIVWLSESLNSLEPATGRMYWSQAYPIGVAVERPAANIAAVRQSGDQLFISSYYHGPMMLQIAGDPPSAKVLWKGKSNNPKKPDGIHAAMCTPTIRDGYIYGVCAYGELRCIRADNGKQVWETMAATTGGKKYDCASAFLVPQGNRFVIFNDNGDLILANLTPTGYQEIDRAHVLDPLGTGRGHQVVLCHPAFAHRCVFVRNDAEMVCVSMAE
jgi:outer membrane protein assembly factor BamB